MGSDQRSYAPFSLLIVVAIFGIVAIFAIFAGPANSQFLHANKNYADNLSQIYNVRFGKHIEKTKDSTLGSGK